MNPTNFCPACGDKVSPAVQFCGKCGRSLIQATEAENPEGVALADRRRISPERDAAHTTPRSAWLLPAGALIIVLAFGSGYLLIGQLSKGSSRDGSSTSQSREGSGAGDRSNLQDSQPPHQESQQVADAQRQPTNTNSPWGKWLGNSPSEARYACFSSDGRAAFGDRSSEVGDYFDDFCTWTPDGKGLCTDPDDGTGHPFSWSRRGDALMVGFEGEWSSLTQTFTGTSSLGCFYEKSRSSIADTLEAIHPHVSSGDDRIFQGTYLGQWTFCKGSLLISGDGLKFEALESTDSDKHTLQDRFENIADVDYGGPIALAGSRSPALFRVSLKKGTTWDRLGIFLDPTLARPQGRDGRELVRILRAALRR